MQKTWSFHTDLYNIHVVTAKLSSLSPAVIFYSFDRQGIETKQSKATN